MYDRKRTKGSVKKFEVQESRLEKYKYTPREATMKTNKTEGPEKNYMDEMEGDDFYNIGGPVLGGPTSAAGDLFSDNQRASREQAQFPYEMQNLMA